MKQETKIIKEAVDSYLEDHITIPLEKAIRKAIISGDSSTFNIIKKYLYDNKLLDLNLEDIESITFDTKNRLVVKKKRKNK